MANWTLRDVPPALVERYKREGWWTDETLGDLLAAGLASMRDATFAVHSAERPWRGTVGDVEQLARRFAAGLRQRGIGPGDVVVFQLPNWVEAAVAFWGASLAGAVIVPVVHFYGPKELGYIAGVTEPALVITPERFGQTDYKSAYTGILDPDRWLTVGPRFDALLDAEPVAGPVAVDPDGPALVAFTSGTTRDPKGVVHSHRTMAFEARQLSAMMPPGGPPPITGAPVGHFIGMLNAFLCSLVKEQPIHLLDVWNPAEVLRLMAEEGLGVSGGSTYFLLSLLDHPDCTPAHIAQIPYAGMGGSPVPVAFTERASALGIEIFRSYGSTEHPSITGSTIEAPEAKRLRTDGCALPGVEVRLDDEGQILSRGPDLFVGYTDPALTAAAFDDDGWYRTGDVGILDDDGYLAITDRLADFIIRGGENISAQEVEEELLRMDGIAEAAVVAEPDPRFGERAAAMVRLLPGAATPTLDDVRAHLAQVGLAKQKWPESLHVLDDFPRTASGKVQKFKLRTQLRREATS